MEAWQNESKLINAEKAMMHAGAGSTINLMDLRS